MPHKLGRLPLPRDDRDWLMRGVARPETLYLHRKFWYRPLVLDQGDTGTCEGNAWTGWLADGPITHPDITDLSDATTGEAYARQLYLDATGDTTLQQGAYTRQILKVLVQRGLIGAYYKAASVDDIITYLLTTGPVCFGSNWYSSMDDPVNEFNNAYLVVDEASGIRGGHEYILDGIELAPTKGGPPYVRMHNSWGPDWAHLGTARISIADLRILFVGDAFICTELTPTTA